MLALLPAAAALGLRAGDSCYGDAIHAGGNVTLDAGATSKGNSKCKESSRSVDCKYKHTTIEGRWVGYQVPDGTAPKAGWPFVILYHGMCLFSSTYAWQADSSYDYGLLYKAEVIAQLLDSGVGVVTPDAKQGTGYWNTNDPAYQTADLSKWSKAPDSKVVSGLLAGCSKGTYGPCDSGNLHAVGFSSGAYMASRMAVNYASSFRSISVNSGAYYYCDGACTEKIADQLAGSVWKAHPPALFLHGTVDDTVPQKTSQMYYERLQKEGVATKRVTARVNHQWLPAAAQQVVSWVRTYSKAAVSARNATA